jgi:hypothetical protein
VRKEAVVLDSGAPARLTPGQAAALLRVADYIRECGDFPRAAQVGVRSAVLVALWRRGLLDRGGRAFSIYAPTAEGRAALRRWTAAVARRPNRLGAEQSPPRAAAARRGAPRWRLGR